MQYFRNEMEFTVLSISDKRGDLESSFVNADVKVHTQSIGYFSPLKWIKFYLLLRKGRYNVLCAMNGSFGGVPVLLAYLARIPNRIVFYRRSSFAFSPTLLKKMYFRITQYFVLVFSNHILSNSTQALRIFYPNKFLNNKKFKVLFNGISPAVVEASESKSFYRNKYNIASNAFVVGHVGRYDKAKNHECIFEIAKNICKQHPNVVFVFCGKDTDSKDFKVNLVKHGVENCSISLGLQNNIGEVLKTFDLFLFPSITEGQPNALIEAMIANLPVLTSNTESIIETLPPHAYKLMHDPNDYLSFIKSIETIVQTPEKLKEYQYQDWALRTFDVDKNFKAFRKIITNE
jgi:glycosyltransferase involved in cell wall biosynthesis